MRSTRIVLLAGLVLTTAGLVGCSSSPPEAAAPAHPGASSSASSAPVAAASPAASSELGVADSPLGKIIVDKGMTAYYFTKDVADSGKSACLGDCLIAWPPITTTTDSPTGEGITAKIGTITLGDGSKQVTVKGMPIHLFAKDKAPGDVTGQGVGKVWYVVAPDGQMMTDAAPSGGY